MGCNCANLFYTMMGTTFFTVKGQQRVRVGGTKMASNKGSKKCFKFLTLLVKPALLCMTEANVGRKKDNASLIWCGDKGLLA